MSKTTNPTEVYYYSTRPDFTISGDEQTVKNQIVEQVFKGAKTSDDNINLILKRFLDFGYLTTNPEYATPNPINNQETDTTA